MRTKIMEFENTAQGEASRSAFASENLLLPRDQASSQVSGDVHALLHFYSPPEDGLKPEFRVTHDSGTGIKNYKHNPVQVLIRDLRSHEASFSLDTHSFAAISNVPLPSIDFSSDRDIQEQYYPKVEEFLLRNVNGSRKVVIFDHCVRKVSRNKALQRPVRKVHIDQTPFAANLRASRHLALSDQHDVAQHAVRLRLINLWRPMKGPVLDHPLAVAESRTLASEDLVEVKHIHPDSTGETYAVKHNSEQKFWYWSRMSVNDVLMLQCYDSVQHADNLGVRYDSRCAHASFELPNSDNKAGNRESIEVRCLVIG